MAGRRVDTGGASMDGLQRQEAFTASEGTQATNKSTISTSECWELANGSSQEEVVARVKSDLTCKALDAEPGTQ